MGSKWPKWKEFPPIERSTLENVQGRDQDKKKTKQNF